MSPGSIRVPFAIFTGLLGTLTWWVLLSESTRAIGPMWSLVPFVYGGLVMFVGMEVEEASFLRALWIFVSTTFCLVVPVWTLLLGLYTRVVSVPDMMVTSPGSLVDDLCLILLLNAAVVFLGVFSGLFMRGMMWWHSYKRRWSSR